MKRTHIYLTEKEQAELEKLSEHKETSKSALIREAVDEYIAKHSEEHRREIIEKVAGIWKNRNDLSDFEKLREEWDRL